MPNKNHGWDSLLERGNPTRVREILDLIKYVKKKEVWQQGVSSQKAIDSRRVSKGHACAESRRQGESRNDRKVRCSCTNGIPVPLDCTD
jgi:hypothetical protein